MVSQRVVFKRACTKKFKRAHGKVLNLRRAPATGRTSEICEQTALNINYIVFISFLSEAWVFIRPVAIF